ncbi:MAG: hypothetical protein COA61_009805 [Zetaproteobacteria bacterium]|nr:hypothetical protein [Zetaproteobacteria bacterium]
MSNFIFIKADFPSLYHDALENTVNWLSDYQYAQVITDVRTAFTFQLSTRKMKKR